MEFSLQSQLLEHDRIFLTKLEDLMLCIFFENWIWAQPFALNSRYFMN